MQVNLGLDIGDLMAHLCEQAASFLADEAGFAVSGPPEQEPNRLQSLVSSLAIEGALEGTIYLSAGEHTVTEMMRRLLSEETPPGEPAVLLRDTLSETLNVVVGKAAKSLDELGLRINLSAPCSLDRDSEQVQALVIENISHKRVLHTKSGPVVLLYMVRN